MIKQSNHRKALEKIASTPPKFGFDDVIAVSIEPILLDKRKRIIAEPDLIFYCLKNEIYIIEYKSNGNERLLKRAKEQLHNATKWFLKYTSLSPKTKIINGHKYKNLL